MPKKILILCVDRDADLKEKVGMTGPIIGRAMNMNAANNLLLKDPEEVDGNTIFEAIKIFDSMKGRGEDVEIATLTGDQARGYTADREISSQLDKVLLQFPAESCIFVSDGGDDEQILPIINSRMKLDAIKQVSMKQSKELERTYLLILDKMKEPYFARIFIGVPALILLGLVVSYSLGFEWRPVAALLGVYLLAKGFGIEDRVLYTLSHFKFSSEEVSTIAYVIAFPLFVLAAWLCIDEYIKAIQVFSALKSIGYALRTLVIFLIPPIILIYVGRLYDNIRASRNLATLRMLFYSVLTAIILYIIWAFASWVTADMFFGELVNVFIVSIIVGAMSMEIVHYLKRDMIRGVDILGKEVYSSSGSYLGKVVSVDDDEKIFIFVNPWKKRESCDYSRVRDIDSKISLV